MLFEDPIRTISVELPVGWTYDCFNSTLTDFYFNRWDRPSELLGLHVRPASIPQELPDEQWVSQIRSEIGDRASLSDISSSRSRAVAAEFSSGKGAAQRVAFIRGVRLELVIEQRTTEPESQDRWTPLERAVGTANSTVNQKVPEQCGAEEFNKFIEIANTAYTQEKFPEVTDALRQALELGTSAWLYSLVPPVNSPEIHAAVRVAQAMMHLSGFTEDPAMQRNAESVLRRAICTLDSMGEPSEAARQFRTELSDELSRMASEILEGTEEKAAGNVSPIVAMRERGFRLAQAGAKALDAHDFKAAYALAGLAADDLLSLIAFLRRNQSKPQEVPEEIASHLASQGITDPAAQIETLQKAREVLLLPPLVLSLQIRFCCALELGDAGFSEATDMLLPVAQLLYKDNPDDLDIAMNLALTLMDCAGALALHDGDTFLDKAERNLDEATQVLESIEASRANDNRWIRYHGRQIESTLCALDRKLAAVGGENDSFSEKRLQEFRFQFEGVAGRFREKVGIQTPGTSLENPD